MQPSEEIKQKLDIVDLIRDYIPLKAAGMNFRAKCPFHKENSPSFMVSPDKQIYHCFGCGKGGDIFSFVMEMDGISFVEALRILAPKAGVVLKRQDPKVTSQRNRILDIIDLSRKYYHKIQVDSKMAENSRVYLEKRGLNEETIDEWQIGFSPDSWDSLLNGLKKKGFKENEIFLAGMAGKSNTSSRFFDRFRGRIMFPINDINGNTVAFTARVSPEKEATEKMGKYINSPQTSVYDKSNILFGLDKAKMEIKNQDMAIIVEGQMDVITAHQHGFKNVIASSGTALTGAQIKLIKRYTENIALAFDQDKAGEMAADRGIREAMQAEMNITVIEIPNGKDPDDCIKNNPDDWKSAVKSAKSMMQYYFDKTFDGKDLKKVENQREVAKILLPLIAKLGNKIEQDFWINTLSGEIGREEYVLRDILNSNSQKKKVVYQKEREEARTVVEQVKKTKEETLSEMFLSILFLHPVLIEYATEKMKIEEIVGEHSKSLYKNLIIYYNNINTDSSENGNEKTIDYHQFKEWLEKEINDNSKKTNQFTLFNRLVFLSERDYYKLDFSEIKTELIKTIKALKVSYVTLRMKEIENMIAEIEGTEKDEKIKRQSVDEMMNQFLQFSEELKEIKND